MGYIITYLIGGICLAEAASVSRRELGGRLGAGPYLMVVTLWPVFLWRMCK